MIYITGDTHGDFRRFSVEQFPQQRGLSREDYMVITGDFGGIWDDSARETYWLDWLEERPFTTLFVDGNHENFDMLYAMPVKEWHGGKVHYVRPHILHLMRGQVFDIGGLTFFTMGGASSHDISGGILDPTSPTFEMDYWRLRRSHALFRVLGRSWWPQELPSQEEYDEAVTNLDRVGWDVDVILTHCAPNSILLEIDQSYGFDALTDFLQMVRRRCEFGEWFFGHYHRDMVIEEKFYLQYGQITELEVTED